MIENGMGAQPIYDICGSKNDNDGMFGGGGGGIFFLFILLLFAGGGNGGGLFGNKGNEAGAGINNTQELVNNTTLRKLDGIESGICDSTYALNNSIKDCCCSTKIEMSNGFNGVNKSLCDIGYKIQDCCCTTNRNIDNSRFEAQRNTCDIITNANVNTRDIIDANNTNTQRLLDFQINDKLATQRDAILARDLQLSQLSQTQAIIRELTPPCSIPAYITCNPNVPYNPCQCPSV